MKFKKKLLYEQIYFQKKRNKKIFCLFTIVITQKQAKSYTKIEIFSK